MWIVRLALKEPHTIAVLAILILLLGSLAIVRTPTDIFPNINIPVVSIIWTFNGLEPQDMADRIVSITERTLTTTVDDIQRIHRPGPAARAVRQRALRTAIQRLRLELRPHPANHRPRRGRALSVWRKTASSP